MKEPYLVIDVAQCENCNNCFLACKDEHVGNDWPGYAAPQPEFRSLLDPHRGQGEGGVPHDRRGLPSRPLHALRGCAMHKGSPGGCNLQEAGRHRDDRPPQGQRAEAGGPGLPLPCDRLERRSPGAPEMYDVRPPPRQGVGEDAVRAVLSHRAP